MRDARDCRKRVSRKELVLEQRLFNLEKRTERVEAALRTLAQAVPEPDDELPSWIDELPHRSWGSVLCTCWPAYATRDAIPQTKQAWRVVASAGKFWPINPRCPLVDVHT